MAKETTYAGKLGDWQRLLAPIAANSADLAHLEASRAKLAELLSQAQGMNREQAAHRAVKQDRSQQLKTLVTEGDRLANLLRQSIKEHYGIRAEKLTEFGVQPFRGRPRKPKTTPVPHPSPGPTPPPAKVAAPAEPAR